MQIGRAGQWRVQRMLLALALVLGVLTMHAIAACNHHLGGMRSEAQVAGGHQATGGTVGPSISSDASVAPIEMGSANTAMARVHDIAGDAASTASGSVVVLAMSAALVMRDQSGFEGSDPMSALHYLGHLCLAVLVAATAFGLAVFIAFLVVGRTGESKTIGVRARHVPSRPPPPTSVRLAQLCVLRN